MDEDEIDYSGGQGDQATATDSTDESDSTDATDTQATPDAAAAPGQPLVMRGSAGPVTVPPPDGQWENPEQLANRAMWQQLRYRFANEPIAQTEAAVSAAVRYQALRQYQNDVATGISPSKALSRIAPLLYNAKENTLGHAASFIRATAPESPKLLHVGNTLYRDNGNGSVTALTTGRQAQPRTSPIDVAEYNSVLRQRAKVMEDADRDLIGSDTFNRHQAQLALLNGQLQDIRRRAQAIPPNPIPGTQAPAAAPQSGGFVRVKHPDGRYGVVPRASLPKALKLGYKSL